MKRGAEYSFVVVAISVKSGKKGRGEKEILLFSPKKREKREKRERREKREMLKG